MRLAAACALVALVAAAAPLPAYAGRADVLAPPRGALLGVSIDFAPYNYNLTNYERRLGRQPASYVLFMSFPLNPTEVSNAQYMIQQMARRKAIVILTLEPYNGLRPARNRAALDALARQMAAWERLGAVLIVRFAHEMNGSWYPWAQRPSEYKATWRLVAQAVRRLTCKATMLWAPNEGGGYPFTGGRYQALCTPAQTRVQGSDCFQLDTNRNGVIDQADNCYLPYYPGSDVVDWVGLSVYHFGAVFPWGRNVRPEARKFYTKIIGEYRGTAGDESGVPNFYDQFCNKLGKPMVIGETAALYNLCDKVPNGRGCGVRSEDAIWIKQAWWKQVFSVQNSGQLPSVALKFPKIKIINWFDIRKTEAEAQGNTVDWTVTGNLTVRNAFLRYIDQGRAYWHWLPYFQQTQRGKVCADYRGAAAGR